MLMEEIMTNLKRAVMGIEEIIRTLPHRPPFLLVDRVVSYEKSKHIVAIKNVTMNEPFFVGHFPEKPIMPGVLILEALAQTAAILAFQEYETDPNIPAKENVLQLFAGIDEARFKRQVVPGDQLRLEITILKNRANTWKALAEAKVDGELACSAILLSMTVPRGVKK
jgi:3-hydroxyacyl-[acyl-carrier-protein] dehydratase